MFDEQKVSCSAIYNYLYIGNDTKQITKHSFENKILKQNIFLYKIFVDKNTFYWFNILTLRDQINTLIAIALSKNWSVK